ncbi:Cysteine-rich RLK (receptor-like protein kinase) 8 [Dorcoceras hygrometricum]|uniref:Cysteine-rich RLK (Receptor-like protein kinase) 8 n=1 Tax=Dorcoceras hygrometricum TaxID=472368 RepID=A0A2Z7C966_9LAMI|nr:Cysteine-rich RLK (receptor-like protein kinase) 8 [Dorcoceras hygrometricum]
MHDPSTQHIKAARRILQYLKGNPGKGIFLGRYDRKIIEVFTYADWVRSIMDRRSTMGYWGNLVT